jgi:hypothetical protein
VWVGAAIVAVGAVAALAIPRTLGLLHGVSDGRIAEPALAGRSGATEELEPAYATVDVR